MKKYGLLAIFVSLSYLLSAQSVYKFTFEDEIPHAQWRAEHGSFSLSEDHYMEGSKSLCWEIPANDQAVFTVSFTSFKTASYATVFYLYTLQPTSNTLVVEFIDPSGSIRKTANVSLDFKGWREFNRGYGKDFLSALSVDLAQVRFTLNNTTKEAQKIFFDNVDFRATTDATRQMTDLMKLDVDQLESSRSVLLRKYANPIDIEATDPTEQEIAGLNSLKEIYPVAPEKASASELRIARTYIGEFDITRNSDGSVKGKPITTTGSALNSSFMLELTKNLEFIASGAESRDSDKELFNDYLDFIIDQGIIYRFPQLTYSEYTTVRTVPKNLLNILPLCSNEQKREVLNMVKWVVEYGYVYENADELYLTLNSDYIYLFLGYLYKYAVNQIEEKDAVRELKAMTRFIGRTLEFSDGSYEVLKRDGTGFHHNAHFNGYMYAFNTWVDVIYPLKGTVYRLPEDAYSRLKHAAIRYYLMSNKGGKENYYANSLCGRHPYYGISNNFSKESMRRMAEIGGDIMGKEIDEEIAAAYNYFISANTYDVSPGSYDGFYQYNYSPMGIYRKDNWVVTMRAPTTKFWGAEIYSATNRLGRYQSHGTLEIMYDGEKNASGIPLANVSADSKGWDWNVVPGTTTVHYTSWQQMMPNGNTTDRFDQYTKTKNFAGALAWEEFGIFAADFDQGDTWGSQRFTPTNLEFKKSVYAFDGMLVSMGTNIQSSGSYGDDMITATNLFQSIRSASSGDLNVNGTIMASGSNPIINDSKENFWMITPEGTGYYVPKGNDKVIIKHGEQQAPTHTGADVSNPPTSVAAKAYIEHGVKPSNKEYLFVVAPATTVEKMQEMANKAGEDGGELFRIESKSENLHSILIKSHGIRAYTFFNAVDNLDSGVVKSVGSEMLLMQRELSDTRLAFAVTNPNLRPADDGTKWLSTPTHTSITVKGEWYTSWNVEGVTVNPPQNGETVVNITLAYGEPVYFFLHPEGYDKVQENSVEEWVRFQPISSSKELMVSFSEPLSENALLELYSSEGILLQTETLSAGNQALRIKIDQRQNNRMYLARVSTKDGLSKVAKFLF